MTRPENHGANRLSLLARAGELLSSPGTNERTLERLATLMVTGFARWCAIDVLDEDGSIRRAAAAPDEGPAIDHHAPHGAAVVMRTGEPDANGNFMCVPLMARDRPRGAITLLAGDRPFGVDDIDVAAELGRRAGAAIETAQLVRSLARSEERYRLLFEASPLPMWVYDSQTLGFLAVNDAAVRHYGYTRQEFLAMTIKDIRPPEDVETVLASIQSSGGPGSPMPGTWRHRKKDGTVIDVEITAAR